MIELELKSVVDDIVRRRAMVERAGASCTFEGKLRDVRYDRPDQSLAARDHVLRLRTYESGAGSRAELEWKGPTQYDDGYKVRDEIGATISDAVALANVLERLDFVATMAIDRVIAQYTLGKATIRFERYPRLDDLVEVEGAPAAIEQAISALGLPRDGFTSDRLADFVRRFEERTGQRAVLCDEELPGALPYDPANA